MWIWISYDHWYWPYHYCERQAGGARWGGGEGGLTEGHVSYSSCSTKEIAPETSAPLLLLLLQERTVKRWRRRYRLRPICPSPTNQPTHPPAFTRTTMVPGSGLPKVHTPSKGRVVARAADRLINDKATFYPVRFRNIDKLCKRLIRISHHPSVLPTRRRCGCGVLGRSHFRGGRFFLTLPAKNVRCIVVVILHLIELYT